MPSFIPESRPYLVRLLQLLGEIVFLSSIWSWWGLELSRLYIVLANSPTFLPPILRGSPPPDNSDLVAISCSSTVSSTQNSGPQRPASKSSSWPVYVGSLPLLPGLGCLPTGPGPSLWPGAQVSAGHIPGTPWMEFRIRGCSGRR